MYDEELSFGEFILERRKKLDMTGRELANKLSISAVYLCDIEKGRKAALTDETLEKLRLVLCLDEAESEHFYDLAAIARNTVSADLPEYIMENEIVRAALRTAKKNNVTDQQWEDFIKKITKQEE